MAQGEIFLFFGSDIKPESTAPADFLKRVLPDGNVLEILKRNECRV